MVTYICRLPHTKIAIIAVEQRNSRQIVLKCNKSFICLICAFLASLSCGWCGSSRPQFKRQTVRNALVDRLHWKFIWFMWLWLAQNGRQTSITFKLINLLCSIRFFFAPTMRWYNCLLINNWEEQKKRYYCSSSVYESWILCVSTHELLL